MVVVVVVVVITIVVIIVQLFFLSFFFFLSNHSCLASAQTMLSELAIYFSQQRLDSDNKSC